MSKDTPVVLLPIEPFEERYSIQWYQYFTSFMVDNNIPHIVIAEDPLTKKIENGEFLDVYGTNWYKMSQIRNVLEKLHTGVIPKNAKFLLLDGWFPGIEALFYVRDALGLDIKIYSCLHAGTWDEWDFLTLKGMKDWARRMEKSWISHYWKSFVATEFHKDLINLERSRKKEKDKVVVTGFPFYWETDPLWHHKAVRAEEKENICVFPHRLALEKNFPAWKEFVDKVEDTAKGWKFTSTKLTCTTKEEYYKLLRKSKIAVSTAYQETWGIAMQEALYSNCLILAPDRLSYSEMYPQEFLYRDMDEMVSKFLKMIKDIEKNQDTKWNDARRRCEANLRKNNENALRRIFTEMGCL